MIQQTHTSLTQIARQAITRFIDDERGATAVEYALLASLIGVAIIGATTRLGSQIGTIFTTVTSRLSTATN